MQKARYREKALTFPASSTLSWPSSLDIREPPPIPASPARHRLILNTGRIREVPARHSVMLNTGRIREVPATM